MSYDTFRAPQFLPGPSPSSCAQLPVLFLFCWYPMNFNLCCPVLLCVGLIHWSMVCPSSHTLQRQLSLLENWLPRAPQLGVRARVPFSTPRYNVFGDPAQYVQTTMMTLSLRVPWSVMSRRHCDFGLLQFCCCCCCCSFFCDGPYPWRGGVKIYMAHVCVSILLKLLLCTLTSYEFLG